MLKQPDPKILEALANLEHNSNFRVIMDWIKESRSEGATQLSVATDVPLYRAQGAYGVLDLLHNHAQKAREVLAQLSRSQ
jgi:hypothetical protein